MLSLEQLGFCNFGKKTFGHLGLGWGAPAWEVHRNSDQAVFGFLKKA